MTPSEIAKGLSGALDAASAKFCAENASSDWKPDKVLRKLNEAQREALLVGAFKIGSMALSLNQLGLIERNHVGPDGGPYVGVIEYTPLGLAVRAIIEQESRGE